MSETASPDAQARLALEMIDEVLRKKPEKDDYALTDIMKRLCIWRDSLIEQARRGDVERERLEHANAVLGVVVAIQFPAGAVPWDELAAARRWLAVLLGDVPNTAEANPALGA
jgi:hypothetical protein